MSEYDNTNSGRLFANEKKTKANQPSLRGDMDLEGVQYWASAWRKITPEKVTYISIALQQKDVENPETINAELHPIANPKSEKAPTFEGTIRMDDEEINIVAWVRQASTTGKSFFSIRVDTPSEGSEGNGDAIDEGDIFFGLGSAQEAPAQQAPEHDANAMDFDDDIPF